MNKSVSLVIFLVCLGLLIAGLFLATRQPPSKYINLDVFARCLTEKGMVMYGAYWCSHCQKIKKDFGDTFKYVKYIECTVETQVCTDNNIDGYPTFIFADQSRLSGEISFTQMAEKTGCLLPPSSQ